MKKKAKDLKPGDVVSGWYYGEMGGYVSNDTKREVVSAKSYEDEGEVYITVITKTENGFYMVPENQLIDVEGDE